MAALGAGPSRPEGWWRRGGRLGLLTALLLALPRARLFARPRPPAVPAPAGRVDAAGAAVLRRKRYISLAELKRRKSHLMRSIKDGSYTPVLAVRALEAHAKAANVTGAERIFDVLLRHGMTVTRECYAAMVRGLAAAELPEAAERWIGYMARAGWQITEFEYFHMIQAHLHASDFTAAEAWLGRMREAGLEPDLKIYGIFLEAHAKAGDAGKAEELLAEITAAGMPVNPQAFDSLVRSLAEQGSWDRADEFVRILEERRILLPVVLVRLLEVSARQGQLDRAEQYFEELRCRGLLAKSDFRVMLEAYGSTLPRGRKKVYALGEEMAALGAVPDLACLAIMKQALGEQFAVRIKEAAAESARVAPRELSFEDGRRFRLRQRKAAPPPPQRWDEGLRSSGL